MRKITTEAVNAFLNGKEFSKSNMTVKYGPIDTGVLFLKLHGNSIAQKIGNNISISNAGWFSNTTKERLNGIPGVSIRQKAGVWYLNGNAWDGSWITINN